jgi:hypothetical protein
MTNINWAKLYSQGRVKAVGVPWSDEELKAIRELKIPLDYVREGVSTMEDYKKVMGKKIKSREEIEEEAKEMGINFTEEAMPETLEKEIEKKKKAEKKGKVVKKGRKTKK